MSCYTIVDPMRMAKTGRSVKRQEGNTLNVLEGTLAGLARSHRRSFRRCQADQDIQPRLGRFFRELLPLSLPRSCIASARCVQCLCKGSGKVAVELGYVIHEEASSLISAENLMS